MIVVAGINHRTAPLSVRESVAISRERLCAALVRLRAEPGVDECAILSTCNRVELYLEWNDAQPPAALPFLSAFHGISPESLLPHLYEHRGALAVRHALGVAASLDSMVLGEAQILGQMKQAFEAAEDAGTLGPVLRALRARALGAAKRVRHETTIGRNAVSVSHVAVELARKVFGDLAGRNVLIVGAGKMSTLAARQLVASGAAATVVGGRNTQRAAELAALFGGRAVAFEDLRGELRSADVVISSTAAPGYVIGAEDVAAAVRARGNRPLLLVDIAAPRDVDPAVRALPEVFLYDLDDLKRVADANAATRATQLAPAAAIVDAETAAFLADRRARQAVPLLTALRRRADDVRRAELARARTRLGPLTDEQRHAVDAVATAIVNKLLHAPTVFLKEAAQDERMELLETASRLLGLEPSISSTGC